MGFDGDLVATLGGGAGQSCAPCSGPVPLATNGSAPSYLAEMLEHKSDNHALHRLRNTANRGPGKLVVHRTRLKTFGPRSFATTGPSLWNSLPTEVTDVTLNISTFKIRLKTFSFKQSFPGRIETLYQLHERLYEGFAIKKRYTNVLYITLHYLLF